MFGGHGISRFIGQVIMKKTARIMIADHDETSLMALESTLAGAGFKVKPVRSGQEALEQATEFKPHICILDPMLPDLDGFTLSMEIRNLGRPVRILISTATPMDDHAKKEAKNRFGVAYCLVKPYSNERLLKVVRAVLTPKKKRTEAEKAKKKSETKLSPELDEMLEKTLSGIDLGPTKRKKKVSDSQKVFTGSRPPVDSENRGEEGTMKINPDDLKLEMEKIKLEMTEYGDATPGQPEVRFRKTEASDENKGGTFTSSDIFGELIQNIEDGKVNESEFTLPGENKTDKKLVVPKDEPEVDLFPDKDEEEDDALDATLPAQSPIMAATEPSGGNKYQFLEKIATGGMAEVWKGKLVGEKGFEKIVAIKKILPHLSANEEFITMFTDEAKVAAKLTHPNIAQIYELKTGDPAFIAMEYVSGHTLRQILLQCRKLEITLAPQIVAYIGMKLCNALFYAHNKKDFDGAELHIVHRDVSPQNVIISQDGEIKLVDFGIAKASIKATETVAGSLKGKLLYMSPEQGDGKPLDHRSDIFSLANVLYEAMTGTRLFEGNSELAILKNVRSASFRSVRQLNPAVSPKLEEIINHALGREPEQRYASAKAMENELKEFLKEEKSHLNEGDIASYLENLFEGDIKKLARFHEGTIGTPLPVAGKAQPAPAVPEPVQPEPAPEPEPVAAVPPPKRSPLVQEAAVVETEPPVSPLMESMESGSKSSLRYIIGLVVLMLVIVGVWAKFFRNTEEVPTTPQNVETQESPDAGTTNSPTELQNDALDADTSSSGEDGLPTEDESGQEGEPDPDASDNLETMASEPAGDLTGTDQPSAKPLIDPETGQLIEEEKNPELERLEEERRKKLELLETLRKKQEEEKKKKKKDN